MSHAQVENARTDKALPERWLGIDFSGDVKMWTPGCRRSNVWVAEIRISELGDNFFNLADLRHVQDLPGAEPPFFRLTRLLSAREFAAAAIDAPFSVPAEFVPDAGHMSLLAAVSSLECDGRPFAQGKTFVNLVMAGREFRCKKPLRVTEAEQKVNVRSTLWARARGGAAMTAACIALLHRSCCPISPWAEHGPGLLVEGFPAAQLKYWGLPFQQYNGSADVDFANRRAILQGLKLRVALGGREEILLACADAIDAIVCALTAASVALGTLAVEPDSSVANREDWIAISR